ncbi:hypothetical protein J4Q44_G00188250 [Coregonus suidteri]|uniref:Uncharacterized protein n=1 Tax=Coregonus suidteri TaxID=861788 RepID=A0AAN8LGH8_9TELE
MSDSRKDRPPQTQGSGGDRKVDVQREEPVVNVEVQTTGLWLKVHFKATVVRQEYEQALLYMQDSSEEEEEGREELWDLEADTELVAELKEIMWEWSTEPCKSVDQSNALSWPLSPIGSSPLEPLLIEMIDVS